MRSQRRRHDVRSKRRCRNSWSGCRVAQAGRVDVWFDCSRLMPQPQAATGKGVSYPSRPVKALVDPVPLLPLADWILRPSRPLWIASPSIYPTALPSKHLPPPPPSLSPLPVPSVRESSKVSQSTETILVSLLASELGFHRRFVASPALRSRPLVVAIVPGCLRHRLGPSAITTSSRTVVVTARVFMLSTLPSPSPIQTVL